VLGVYLGAVISHLSDSTITIMASLSTVVQISMALRGWATNTVALVLRVPTIALTRRSTSLRDHVRLLRAPYVAILPPYYGGKIDAIGWYLRRIRERCPSWS